MYSFLDILGTVAFAISGAMTGIRAKMDILGVIVLGVITAVGGGIIRDVLVGITPPSAFRDPIYAGLAVLVSIVVFLPPVRKRVDVDGAFLNFIDALGLGMFSVAGVLVGRDYGNLFLPVFLGVLTGVGGGVLRDIFAMQMPTIFVRYFYAIASFIGALLCALLLPVSQNLAMISGIIVVVVLRVLAAHYKWHLPRA